MAKSNSIPMYQVIFNDLFEKIHNGTYKEGDKIPTEKELMEQYSTSRITAARAVQELEKKHFVKRVKATGSFVTPSSTWMENSENPARLFQPTIAVIIPSPAANISIEMEVLQGISMACRNHGYSMSIYNNDSDSDENKSPYDFEKELISELIDLGVVGAIIFPSTTNESPEVYNLMIRKVFPFVLLDRQVFGVEASSVSSENRNGFYSIVEDVIRKGHTRIAFVSGNTHESSSRTDRFYGFTRAMNDYKLEIEEKFIIHHLFPENHDNQYYKDIYGKNEYYQSSIKSMLDTLLFHENPPSAIVTSNDYIALNIMSVAIDLGYKIPEDISITGFDGLGIRDLFTPKLTTVAQDFLTMGQTSVSLLDQIVKNPHRKTENIEIPTKLVQGNSVKDLTAIVE